MRQGTWSHEEHDRFLEAIKLYREGPWRYIAGYIGTRSVRQVQTHAQKYHEKIVRRMRGVRKERRHCARQEHRIDEELFFMPRPQSTVPTADQVSAFVPPPVWGFDLPPLPSPVHTVDKHFLGGLPPLRYSPPHHYTPMDNHNMSSPFLPWPQVGVYTDPSP